MEKENKGIGTKAPMMKTNDYRNVMIAVVAVLVMISSMFVTMSEGDASPDVAEYQQLDYIDINQGGLCLVNTEMKLGSISKVELDIMMKQKVNNSQILLVGTTTNEGIIERQSIYVANNVINDSWGDVSFGNPTHAITKDMNESCVLKNQTDTTAYRGVYTIDNISFSNEPVMSYDLSLFSWSDFNWTGNMNVYSVKIYDKEGELSAYMIPCMKSTDKTVGLYDIVRDRYFGIYEGGGELLIRSH